MASTSTTIPAALAPALQSLLQARYGPAQREEYAGWRGVFEERVEDGALVATRDVEAGETVFLIDHLWCTTLLEARAQLTAHPFIRRNLQVVLGIDEESESDADDEEEEEGEYGEEYDASAHAYGEEGDDAMRARLLAFLGIETEEAEAAARVEVDLDGVVEDPQQQPEPCFLSYILWTLPRLFPNVEALSLQSLGLGAGRAAEVKATVQALPRLKALWLNGNGVARVLASDAELQGRLEIYNRRLTGAYSAWALRYLADGDECEGPTKVDLSGRGLTALHAEAFASLPSLRWLDLSRNPQLPSRLLLPALQTLPRLESLRVDVTSSDEEERLARALPRLRWVNGRYITRVRSREGDSDSSSVVLDDDGDEDGQRTRRRAEIIDKVLMGVWALAEPMRLAGPTELHHAELHWCVLDVPGLALGHDSSDKANVALLHMRDRALGVTFTAAWPTRRIGKGERVTRDYLEGFPPAALDSVDPLRLLAHLCGPRRRRALQLQEAPVAREQEEEERVGAEPAPAVAEEDGEEQQPVFPIEKGVTSLPRPLRVYTDMPVLREHLGLLQYFAFTDDPADADIVWTAGATPTPNPEQKQWRGTLPNLGAVDDKCGMARLLLSPQPPPWLPRTFCLPEELHALLRYWERLMEGAEEQLWILKPPHLARGWDIALATELPCVLRHLQASGRLSVSRYLPRPALWADGHKYDLRFYCLLLSPTQVLIHEHFRVRRAAQSYSLQRRHRQDLRRHLTNTTLGVGAEAEEENAGCPTETLHMDAFVAGFAWAHPTGPGWPPVRARIEGMLADCFGRLARAEGGLGNGEADPYGRALLGVDVLLDGDSLAPFLLELNAAPNVIGICRERPAFWDEVFAAAFVRSEGVAGAFRPLLIEG